MKVKLLCGHEIEVAHTQGERRVYCQTCRVAQVVAAVWATAPRYVVRMARP